MKINNVIIDPRALLGELLGTFILALVAISVQGNVIMVGFTLLALMLVFWSISGANLNPAVTFGLWSVKKIETIKVPFYWVMQFAGALLALIVAGWYNGNGLGISLASFNNLDGQVFFAELLGAAILVFVFVAAIQRGLDESAKALVIGFGFMAALAAGAGLLSMAAQSASTSAQKSGSKEQPRITRLGSITANPAIALATSEQAPQQSALNQSQPAATTQPSRLTWETVLGTLIGGAIGANLYMLAAGVNPFEQKKRKKTKASVMSVFKKGKK